MNYVLKNKKFPLALVLALGVVLVTVLVWRMYHQNQQAEIFFQSQYVTATKQGNETTIEDRAGGVTYGYTSTLTYTANRTEAEKQEQLDSIGVDTDTIKITILKNEGIQIEDKLGGTTFTKTVTKKNSTVRVSFNLETLKNRLSSMF